MKGTCKLLIDTFWRKWAKKAKKDVGKMER
jgi:hypothetical protein